MMLNSDDAIKITQTVAKNLMDVTKNQANFRKLPDSFWGYFARGHDQKGNFGVIITYSENKDDVDNLIKMYEEWVRKNKTPNEKE